MLKIIAAISFLGLGLFSLGGVVYALGAIGSPSGLSVGYSMLPDYVRFVILISGGTGAGLVGYGIAQIR